jgi:membrane fusion protein (multidrug efflux system)
MFAVAKLELSERKQSVVPTTAIARDESQARIFAIGPDKQIQERLVQLGETKGDLVAVLSGVRLGETVVVQPGPDVRDGARVE